MSPATVPQTRAIKTAQYSVMEGNLVRDYEAIMAVWQRNLTSLKKLEEKYRWHFENNPYGPGRCWLLLDGGRPIGTAFLGARHLQIGSKVERIGVACDLAVNREHRFLLPALMLQKAVTSSGIRLVYGLPNHNGSATARRVGYRDAGEVHRYVRVLSVSRYLQQRSGTRYGRLAGAVADVAYSALMRYTDRLHDDYVVEMADGFDERFDELWNGRRPDYPIAMVRDRQYLSWRFGKCPLRDYTTLTLLSRDRSRLAGYAIRYMDGDCVTLADLMVGPTREDADALITAALIDARKAGARSLSLQGSLPSYLRDVLSHRGFRQRTESPHAAKNSGKPAKSRQVAGTLLVYSEREPEPALSAPWYFTAGDEPYN
jgi:hypothetical protein